MFSLTLRLMKPGSLLLALVLFVGSGATAPAQTAASDPLAHSTQLIVVTTSDWSAVEGHLQRYERDNPHASWRPIAPSTPIVVGKTGLAWGIGATSNYNLHAASDPVKHEGDGKAPAGIFALGTAFGYSPQPLPASKMPYLALTPSTECVDDAASTHYNRLVDRTAVTPDWSSSEHMRSAGASYQWGIVVDYNNATTDSAPPTPHSGSCIFLHIWKGPQAATVGCTAMSQTNLESLLLWLDPKRNPLLAQLPAQQYAHLIHRWHLPTVINIPTR